MGNDKARKGDGALDKVLDETKTIRKGSDTKDLGISTDSAVDAVRRGRGGAQ